MDHPRSRGVYFYPAVCFVLYPGSSPLARGLPFQFSLSDRWAWDHPRSRGVYIVGLSVVGGVSGSSPLARGLRRRMRKRPSKIGIIPARAGFTPILRRNWWTARDHPRSRGVYHCEDDGMTSIEGSSPLARGLRVSSKPAWGYGRIIPARAGFTNRNDGVLPSFWDHPRSRGVYGVKGKGRSGSVGSSPLARGLRSQGEGAVGECGIIPARAGFTCLPDGRHSEGPDHPRSRGVYPDVDLLEETQRGSSPLARGLRGQPGPYNRSRGIIPARAGFTPSLLRPRRRRWDHPRSRGVYIQTAVLTVVSWGSSPLARGLHLRILGIPTNPHSTRPLLPSLPT